MWEKFLMKCTECWESFARWYCDGKDITKEELKMAKTELFFYVMLFLLALFSSVFVQVAVAQEAFTLTSAEMEELESLLDGLEKENKQLTKRQEGLTSLAERLKEALAMRDESLNALQNSYDAFEKDAKMTMSKMSSEIVVQAQRIALLKKKIWSLLTLLFLMLLMMSVYVVLKIRRG